MNLKVNDLPQFYFRFGIFSPKEIKKLAVIQVNDVTLYRYHRPTENGLNSLHMGTVDRQFECTTCGKTSRECQGHYGYINLSYPVYHPGYIDLILKTLKCICYCCGNSKIELNIDEESEDEEYEDEEYEESEDEEYEDELDMDNSDDDLSDNDDDDEDYYSDDEEIEVEVKSKSIEEEQMYGIIGKIRGKDKLNTVSKQAEKVKICPHCKFPQPILTKSVLIIKSKFTEKQIEELDDDDDKLIATEPFTPLKALQLLKLAPFELLKKIGFKPEHSHPSNMIITLLLVPPPAIRPSVVISEGGKMRGQNDLTNLIQEVLKSAVKIEKSLQEQNLNKITIEKHGKQKKYFWNEEMTNMLENTPLCTAEVLTSISKNINIDNMFLQNIERLQYALYGYMINSANNPFKSSVHRSGRQKKPIMKRFGGKEGIFYYKKIYIYN